MQDKGVFIIALKSLKEMAKNKGSLGLGKVNGFVLEMFGKKQKPQKSVRMAKHALWDHQNRM